MKPSQFIKFGDSITLEYIDGVCVCVRACDALNAAAPVSLAMPQFPRDPGQHVCIVFVW